MLLLSPTMLAQQSTSITALNELGPENSAMAQRAGLWDVIETICSSPTSTPTKQNLVVERRMVGSFLEEVLESAPNSAPADIKRIDYLSFNRIEGRWKYVSMDTRAPVGLMPAASDDRGENGSIHLTFEPFAIPTASTNITGQLVLMQELIVQDSPDHDRKDQYFNVADGSGKSKSWLGHRYEYVRRHAQ